ncbi:hypothetical protein [Amycolatopsis jejuensis]|nr:hypothetical protein [Amycolatopsis jejuensis]
MKIVEGVAGLVLAAGIGLQAARLTGVILAAATLWYLVVSIIVLPA